MAKHKDGKDGKHEKFGKAHGGFGGEMKSKLIDSPMASKMVPKGGGKMSGGNKSYKY